MLVLTLKLTQINYNYKYLYPGSTYFFKKLPGKGGATQYKITQKDANNRLFKIAFMQEKEFEKLLKNKSIIPLPNSYLKKMMVNIKGGPASWY